MMRNCFGCQGDRLVRGVGKGVLWSLVKNSRLFLRYPKDTIRCFHNYHENLPVSFSPKICHIIYIRKKGTIYDHVIKHRNQVHPDRH